MRNRPAASARRDVRADIIGRDSVRNRAAGPLFRPVLSMRGRFMPGSFRDPAAARQFALDVVGTLRAAGHESYWAGGCVRDELLGRTPADYDVATAARPDEVRTLFGRRRTLAVGAAFGVITVLGPREAGQVEVATFRVDAAYEDGRRPTGVTYSSAREDALRRDFTINGLFFDPLTGTVHDYVGGRSDLETGIVRAIGVPADRFAEDHLRMLRAVRFAAFFGFALEARTRAALEAMKHLVVSVSPERIAAELRGMVSRPGRREALELLAATGLAFEVLDEVAAGETTGVTPESWARSARIIGGLDEPDLPLALAVLAGGLPAEDCGGGKAAAAVAATATRLRLSNREATAAAWLERAVSTLGGATVDELRRMPWSRLQPLVAHEFAPALADLLRARAAEGNGDAAAAAWLTAQVTRPRGEIDPPPLLTGRDLLAAGVAEGPALGATLARIRELQLDGMITTRDEALAALDAAR
jgi:poly(A) polymerase